LYLDDHQQAGQKAWLAADKAMKSLAQSYNLIDAEMEKLNSHANKRKFANHLAMEFGGEINDYFDSAIALHSNFYDGGKSKETVQRSIDRVAKFIQLVEEVEPKCSQEDMEKIFSKLPIPKSQKNQAKMANKNKISDKN
jgi:hypothetical protein